MAFDYESENLYRLDKAIESSDNAIIMALLREVYDTVMTSQEVHYDFDVWAIGDGEGEYLLNFIYDTYSTSLEEAQPINVASIVAVQPLVDNIIEFIYTYSP